MRRAQLAERGLVRLIPKTAHRPPVLRGLVDSDDEMEVLAALEGLTSARLTAEAGRSPHIDRRELAWRRRARDLAVYGLEHVNAAFTYTRRGGNRFNGEERGAWYASWTVLTSIAEVAFHRTRELAFVGVFHDSAIYVELLADVIGEFPDLGDEPAHPALDADPAIGYPEGQSLARQLVRQGHGGLVYPSVRHPGGRCFVAFEPSVVRNVRPGASWQLHWRGTPEFDVVAV